MKPRPIEIVGGGLAGLSLGTALARAGVAVTLHETGDYPRHRVCGEFITGLSATTVAQLGLEPVLADALRHREVAWSIGDGAPQIQQLPAPALGLSRYALDARLAAAFVNAGGELRTHSRVADLTSSEGRVFATGRRAVTGSRWIGLKVHVHNVDLTRDLEMHLGDACYVGLSRVEGETANVCGLFLRRALSLRGAELLLEYLRAAGLDALADRLAAAEIDAASFCAVAALHFDARVRRSSRILVGDAGAAIPPFTGNGMAMAFQSAEAALSPLLAYARGARDWTETCRDTNLALRRRFRVRLASAEVLHPFLLRPQRQRWFAGLSSARLLPFRALYATLH